MRMPDQVVYSIIESWVCNTYRSLSIGPNQTLIYAIDITQVRTIKKAMPSLQSTLSSLSLCKRGRERAFHTRSTIVIESQIT